MADTLATLRTKVQSLLQEQAGLLTVTDGGDIDRGIAEALEAFAQDVPREVVADVAGDGSTFDLDLPTGFVFGWSRFLAIEYPAGERLPQLLTVDDWSFYRTEAATKLRLLHATPGTGETVRLTYSALHTIDGLDGADVTTIPVQYTEAFVWLATAKALYRLATRFLHEQDSSINVDVINRHSKADEARRLANALLTQYRELVGAQGGAAPAQLRVDWDTSVSRSGVSLLTHPERRH